MLALPEPVLLQLLCLMMNLSLKLTNRKMYRQKKQRMKNQVLLVALYRLLKKRIKHSQGTKRLREKDSPMNNV